MSTHAFITEDFLLHNETARRLYHEYVRDLPIIDYHCHLPPDEIAGDKRFENITQVWLNGDHYKWRAMRTNGVQERYVTGDAPDREKFRKWADTVPYTLRNPLHHWTHLELLRYFGETRLLGPDTADSIYTRCGEILARPDFSAKGLIRMSRVEIICTTDDPADTLEHHIRVRETDPDLQVLPAFRPDKAIQIENPAAYRTYLEKLEAVSRKSINSVDDLLEVLKDRHAFFHEQGCRISDHGLEYIPFATYTWSEVSKIFQRVLEGRTPDPASVDKFKSALLHVFAEWDHEKGWVQQYHIGALRANNSRMLRITGPDSGWDSICDFPQAVSLARFLNRLDAEDKLAKTILYNLNPADNELFATMTGNFNDGSVAGKIQYGSGWWFLDQKEGITRQLNALSNMGLVSRFIGMLTDSRSFLSYPRHEYFRRILCNIFGEEMEAGELPADFEWTGKILRDISYYNARNYFPWPALPGSRDQQAST